MKKILITGGAGMIGQEIARQLDKSVWQVYLYDNLSNSYNDYSNLVGENLYPLALSEVFKTHIFDVISHHAASVGVGESMYKPFKYCMNGGTFTAELIQAIIDTKWIGRIIHAGSMGPYGEMIEPAQENYPLNPTSFYGLMKKNQEEQLKMLAESFDSIRVTSLRYFSVYSSEFNLSNPFTGVLSMIVEKILNGGELEFFGDGTDVRDLVHVKDVAEVHNFFLNNEKWEESFQAFNVATGFARELREIINMVRKSFDHTGSVSFNGKKRTGDIKFARADISKLKSTMKQYNPKSLQEGIEEYKQFVMTNLYKIKVGNGMKESENLISKGLLK